MREEVYIVSAVRTPIGSFGGALAGISATELGATAIKEAIGRSSVDPSWVKEAYVGNVISANLGQAPARQAVRGAGLPDSVVCTTVNKVCASGLKSVILGTQSIMLGDADVVVAGGMESMSNIPYYLPKARFGYRYGNASLVDGLVRDGLADAYDHSAMGTCGDHTASRYTISREDQDAYAIRSYSRAKTAWDKGWFQEEVIKVEVPERKGVSRWVDQDEEYLKIVPEKVPLLKPAFSEEGSVTAANASTLNDGASALVLVSKEVLEREGLKPLARIVHYAEAEQEPQWFTTTPVLATTKLLEKANLSIDEIDYFEVNEAFSVVALVYAQLLKINQEKLNIWGGAVALGHPLGASGARILVTLLNVLKTNRGKYGVAAICNGGGGASAILVENLQ